jgi:enamine deaminase RidA (YjgF/YER057c/UK114 family)
LILVPAAQAIVSNGTVYASGNIGMTRDGKVVEGGVQEQTVRYYLVSIAIRPEQEPMPYL